MCFFVTGSSLSHISSSSPSSTPTDSDSHGGVQTMHISESLTQHSFQTHSTPTSIIGAQEDDNSTPDGPADVVVPPPIASRPEKTKSIVSLYNKNNCKIFFLI